MVREVCGRNFTHILHATCIKKFFCLVLDTGTIGKYTMKHPAKNKTGLLLYIVFLVYKKLRNFNTKQTNYQLFEMSGFSSNPKLAFNVFPIDMAPFKTELLKNCFLIV